MADVIAELLARLGFEVKAEGLDKFKQGLADGEKKTKSFGGVLKGGAAGIAAFGTAAIAAAGKVLQFVEGVVSTNDEIAKTAGKLSISTDQLQRLRFAAQRSGAEVQSVSDAVKDSNKQLFESKLVGGKTPFGQALGALGISLDQFEAMSPEQRLGAVGDSLKLLESDADRTALAMTIFGEGGKELLPLMMSGAEGIKGMGDEAERLGGVLGGDALKQSEQLADQMLNVRTVVGGLVSRVGVELIPVVSDIADRMTAWIDENQEFIKQDLPHILEAIVDVGAAVIGFFVDALASVDDLTTEIGHLAFEIDQEYGEAIRGAIETGEQLIGVWGKIAEAIAKGALELLEFVGIIDDADEALMKLKLGFGIETEPTTTQRGAPGFLGGESNPNNQALEAQRQFEQRIGSMNSAQLIELTKSGKLSPSQFAEAQTAIAYAINAEAKATQGAFSVLGSAQKTAGDAAKAREIAKRLAKLRQQGSGGGGGDKVDTRAADAQFGDLFRTLAGQQGLGDKAIEAALEAAAGSLESGAKADVARRAGIGALEGLSGASDLGRSADDVLADMMGKGSGIIGGGGASPVAGAQFVRIDASFNSPTEVVVQLPAGALTGMTTEQQLRAIGNVVAEQIDDRNRRAFDHYRKAVRL